MCKTEKETQMYRTDFWTLWEKVRVGWSERIALKQVYYQGWNRSPAQVGCMRQGLVHWEDPEVWDGEGGRRTHVNPWLIHVNVWQKSLQYCKVISLQLIKINEKINKNIKKENMFPTVLFFSFEFSDYGHSLRLVTASHMCKKHKVGLKIEWLKGNILDS